jgi:hypothetical protein
LRTTRLRSARDPSPSARQASSSPAPLSPARRWKKMAPQAKPHKPCNLRLGARPLLGPSCSSGGQLPDAGAAAVAQLVLAGRLRAAAEALDTTGAWSHDVAALFRSRIPGLAERLRALHQVHLAACYLLSLHRARDAVSAYR